MGLEYSIIFPHLFDFSFADRVSQVVHLFMIANGDRNGKSAAEGQ